MEVLHVFLFSVLLNTGQVQVIQMDDKQECEQAAQLASYLAEDTFHFCFGLKMPSPYET